MIVAKQIAPEEVQHYLEGGYAVFMGIAESSATHANVQPFVLINKVSQESYYVRRRPLESK